MTVCVRARVCMCVQAYLAFCYLFFFEAYVCFCVFCVCMPSSFGYRYRWLVSWDLVICPIPCPSPHPPVGTCTISRPVPSFSPFNPFFYVALFLHPPHCLCMTVAFMDSKCLGVCVSENVCKCVCALESDVHCCAPLVPAGAGCPALGCSAVCG